MRLTTRPVARAVLGHRGYTREASPDGRQPLLYDYDFVDTAPLALMAGALYEGKYPLVSALSRPLIVRHLVQAEEGYLFRLTGERVSEPIPEGPVALEDLAERVRRMGPRWEVIAEDAELPDQEVITSDGWRLPAAIPMAQAIHHADDHRSHVMSILGALGLDVPTPDGLDLWGYAEAEGLVEKVDESGS